MKITASIALLMALDGNAHALDLEIGLGANVKFRDGNEYQHIDAGRDHTDDVKGVVRLSQRFGRARLSYLHFSSIESTRDGGADIVYLSITF